MPGDLHAFFLPLFQVFKGIIFGAVIHGDEFHFHAFLKFHIADLFQNGIDKFFLIIDGNYYGKSHFFSFKFNLSKTLRLFRLFFKGRSCIII